MANDLASSGSKILGRNAIAINFPNLTPTQYLINKDGISWRADVQKSASALLVPFDAIVHLEQISLEFKLEGQPLAMQKDLERTKHGDDFALRIGLMLSGPAPLIPFFAPQWWQLVAGSLKFSCDRMLYLVYASAQVPDSRWSSPYNNSIEQVAVAGVANKEGWTLVTKYFPESPQLLAFGL